MMQINERSMRFRIRSFLSLTLPVSLSRSIRMDVSGFFFSVGGDGKCLSVDLHQGGRGWMGVDL
ncbi:hypothetical protein TSH7_04260 [Azospirillum sp. TSH7]|nr:hypothetical protein TSH20_21640 [Azospirillum sp. TSH20]PWC67533.1 hypothetical protein TSH7_04260 [Azospirillum sp. TSH7]